MFVYFITADEDLLGITDSAGWLSLARTLCSVAEILRIQWSRDAL